MARMLDAEQVTTAAEALWQAHNILRLCRVRAEPTFLGGVQLQAKLLARPSRQRCEREALYSEGAGGRSPGQEP